MDVKALVLLVADPAAAHVCLVSKDQGGGHRIDREGGRVVVMADGGDDSGYICRFHSHLIQNTKGHNRAGLGVIVAVDHVADVVHKTSNAGQFLLMSIITKLYQNVSSDLSAACHMGKAVFCKT